MGVRLLFGRYSSVLHTPQNGFGVRATSYPLRVGFFPPTEQSDRGCEFDHTFPFIDDVNAWRCVTTPLYVSIV
jgi:hypothetical protein